jgi:hypothetical protein
MRKFAWHFCAVRDGKPVLRDGTPLVIGEWLRYTGDVKICESGLHASYWPRDAVGYAPGAFVTYCEVSDVVTEQADKLVCRARKPLFGFDATEPLRLFARYQALNVAHLWKMPDVVRQWLETGEESLRSAAESAAESAAWSAAESATESAAESAANEDLELLLFAYAEHLGLLPEGL